MTPGDKTTTWEEVLLLLVSHGVMFCYLGLQDCQNCQTYQPEDKKSCNAFRNLLRHTGKLCQSISFNME